MLALVGAWCTIDSQNIVISNSESRNYIDLDGKWKYIIDAYETGQIGFMSIYENSVPKDKSDRVEYSFDRAQTLWVPGSWNAQKPELYYYEGTIWYRKTFDMENITGKALFCPFRRGQLQEYSDIQRQCAHGARRRLHSVLL